MKTPKIKSEIINYLDKYQEWDKKNLSLSHLKVSTRVVLFIMIENLDNDNYCKLTRREIVNKTNYNAMTIRLAIEELLLYEIIEQDDALWALSQWKTRKLYKVVLGSK